MKLIPPTKVIKCLKSCMDIVKKQSGQGLRKIFQKDSPNFFLPKLWKAKHPSKVEISNKQ